MLFRVGSGFLWGWLRGYFGLVFKVYVGLVSGVFKVGLVIYFWLVQGWFGICVGLVCGLFGFAYDLFRVGSLFV